MEHKACTVLTKSLLPVPLAIALAVALAACASASGTAATGGRSGPPSASVRAGSGSAGSGGAVAGSGSAVGSSGAGSGGAGGTASVLAAARALSCPPPGVILRGPYPLRPPSLAIPAGFRAVAVVWCVPIGGIAPANAQGTYVRKEVAVTGLGPLVTALRMPSSRRNAVALDCLLPLIIMPRIALIGSDGAVVYPRIPVNVCGVPIPQVAASLGALHWIFLSTNIDPQYVHPQGPPAQGGLTPQPAVSPGS
jgi:hypothetical protein